ncbi:MAG: hypothetical protein QXO32_07765, partial [Candidatus Bathyarchaeia archaeon]
MDRRRYFKYVGAIVVGVGLAAAGFHVWRVSAPPKPLQLYKGFEFLSSTLEKYYLARLKGFKESFDEAQPARGIIYSVSRDHWYLMNFPPFAGWRGALEAWFHVKRRFKTSNIRLKGWLH